MRTSPAAPIGSAHKMLIQRRPMRIPGTTPCCGGSQSLSTMRSSAALRVDAMTSWGGGSILTESVMDVVSTMTLLTIPLVVFPPKKKFGQSRAGCLSMAGFLQCLTFVHRDVLGRTAPDFVLRIVVARVMGVSLVLNVLRMHFDDRAAHVPGLRVPGHVVADFESFRHGHSPITAASGPPLMTLERSAGQSCFSRSPVPTPPRREDRRDPDGPQPRRAFDSGASR